MIENTKAKHAAITIHFKQTPNSKYHHKPEKFAGKIIKWAHV